MATGIVHPARLAWDAARIIVAVADSDDVWVYQWLAGQLDLLCGPEYERALSVSRTRLMYHPRPDAVAVEAGTWRVRLQELLGNRPDLVPRLSSMLAELAPHLDT